ncbi:MAG: HD domain-containing protein [Anaerolineales bacterium]|jgi:hypothetical protein
MNDFSSKLLTNSFFPLSADEVPFGDMLNQIFFRPQGDNKDYPIHGPNVIRFIEAFVDKDLHNEPGLLKGNFTKTKDIYAKYYPDIIESLEARLGTDQAEENRRKVTELLKVAALYHDIGKYVRRANHPQIGNNLLRNYRENDTRDLIDLLVFPGDDPKMLAKFNRFSLISSIVQHHDKFGVVSTGEGGLPIFSDILYFTSGKKTIDGIKKNITSVMLMNLADIAAVNTANEKKKEKVFALVNAVGSKRRGESVSKAFSGMSESELLNEIIKICMEPESCLGIDHHKLINVLSDWKILIKSISSSGVKGNRVQLKLHLLKLERSPARAIQRILRLLEECALTTKAPQLINYFSPTSVESVLVGTLGAHVFKTFCEHLATVAKLDYGLIFFQAVMCACIRNELHDDYELEHNEKKGWKSRKLSEEEQKEFIKKLIPDDTRLTDLANKIMILFVRVLDELVSRYAGVLDCNSPNPRRFGFQMKGLSSDEKILDTIIGLLCIKEHKDPIALTWIVDEITIWSMD